MWKLITGWLRWDLDSSSRRLRRKSLALPATSKGGFPVDTGLLLSEVGGESSRKRGVDGRFQADDLTELDRQNVKESFPNTVSC